MAKKKITIEQITMAETQLQTMQRQVDYDTKDYTVELLLSKFERGDFFIPDYQRQYVWKANNRSLFIESVLLGLPIPFMFFAGCDDGRLETKFAFWKCEPHKPSHCKASGALPILKIPLFSPSVLPKFSGLMLEISYGDVSKRS